MKGLTGLLLAFLLACAIGCHKRTTTETTPKTNAATPNLQGKRVLMIIASNQFRDEEYSQPRAALDVAGAKVDVASSKLDVATGMLGLKVKPDLLLDDVDVSKYDALIFVGGVGASEYFNNATAHKLAKEAVAAGKVVGAICIAPSTLANAGVLDGKKATCYPSEKENLVKHGATYTGEDVTVDGKIVTANGPKAARAFAQQLVKLLQENS